MERWELPQATSSRSGSYWRMARAVSAASRPYSSAVLCPSCHGPSISLPRHHIRMSCGSLGPWLTRRSDRYVPFGWLQYSSRSMASCMPRVPRFTASITSRSALAAQRANSLRPNSLVSIVRQAGSSRVGRSATGPTPSSQRYPERKFPRGYPHDGHAQLTHQFQDVLTEPVRVRGGMSGVVQARVYVAAHVLHEGAEGPAIDGSDDEGRVDVDRRADHGLALPAGWRRRGCAGVPHGVLSGWMVGGRTSGPVTTGPLVVGAALSP